MKKDGVRKFKREINLFFESLIFIKQLLNY